MKIPGASQHAKGDDENHDHREEEADEEESVGRNPLMNLRGENRASVSE